MGTEKEEDWKAKYEACSEKLDALKKLSLNAVKEYEDVLQQLDETDQELKQCMKKLQEKEMEIEELSKLIEPAVVAYDKLHVEVLIEKGCKEEAVKYATQVKHLTQVVQENKKLKRQSQDLLKYFENNSPLDIPIAIFETPEEADSSTQYANTLNEKITELKEEVATLKANLNWTQEMLATEQYNNKHLNLKCENLKVRLQQTETSLNQHRDALKDLAKMSEEALKEYISLQEQFEEEVKRRNDMEEDVKVFTHEHLKMKRQSNALIMDHASDNKMMKALNQIEELSDQLRDQKQKFEEEIEKLQVEVSQLSKKAREAQENGEKEKKQLQGEKDEFQIQLKEYEQKYLDLEAKYKELEKKYDDATRPPPPPPPPPLPSLTEPLKGFLGRMKNKKETSKLSKSGVNLNDNYSKAVSEMMDSIRKGTIRLISTETPIKRVEDADDNPKFDMRVRSHSFVHPNVKPSKDSKAAKFGAMGELNNLMKKLKRSQSENDILSPEISESPGFQQGSELAETFKRVRNKTISADSGGSLSRPKDLASLQEERNLENDVFHL